MGCWGLVIYAMTAATCSGNNKQTHMVHLMAVGHIITRNRLQETASVALYKLYSEKNTSGHYTLD